VQRRVVLRGRPEVIEISSGYERDGDAVRVSSGLTEGVRPTHRGGSVPEEGFFFGRRPVIIDPVHVGAPTDEGRAGPNIISSRARLETVSHMYRRSSERYMRSIQRYIGILEVIRADLTAIDEELNAVRPRPQPGLGQNFLRRLRVVKATGEEDAECTICISGLEKGDEMRLLPCKHIFHRNCLDLWLGEAITCPNCKGELGTPEFYPVSNLLSCVIKFYFN